MRLQQICCGFIKNDEEEVQEVPSNRLHELVNVCEETDGKVIIWASYVHDIEKICEMSQKSTGPTALARSMVQHHRKSGSVSLRVSGPRLEMRFVGNSRTGGFGITLTKQILLSTSNNYDLEIRLQSEDRAHRIGQKNNVTYIDLVSPKTIDDKILTALRISRT